MGLHLLAKGTALFATPFLGSIRRIRPRSPPPNSMTIHLFFLQAPTWAPALTPKMGYGAAALALAAAPQPDRLPTNAPGHGRPHSSEPHFDALGGPDPTLSSRSPQPCSGARAPPTPSAATVRHSLGEAPAFVGSTGRKPSLRAAIAPIFDEAFPANNAVPFSIIKRLQPLRRPTTLPAAAAGRGFIGAWPASCDCSSGSHLPISFLLSACRIIPARCPMRSSA